MVLITLDKMVSPITINTSIINRINPIIGKNIVIVCF